MNNAGGLLPSCAWERLLRIPPVFLYISNNRGLGLEEVSGQTRTRDQVGTRKTWPSLSIHLFIVNILLTENYKY